MRDGHEVQSQDFQTPESIFSPPFGSSACLRRWGQSRMETITKFNRQKSNNSFSSPLPSSFSSFSPPLPLIIIICNKSYFLARGRPGLEDKEREKQMTQKGIDSSHQIYDLCDLEQITWPPHGSFSSSSSGKISDP